MDWVKEHRRLVATIAIVVLVSAGWFWRETRCRDYERRWAKQFREADERGLERFTIDSPPFGCSGPENVAG